MNIDPNQGPTYIELLMQLGVPAFLLIAVLGAIAFGIFWWIKRMTPHWEETEKSKKRLFDSVTDKVEHLGTDTAIIKKAMIQNMELSRKCLENSERTQKDLQEVKEDVDIIKDRMNRPGF